MMTRPIAFQVIGHLSGENPEGPTGASTPQGHQPSQRSKGETGTEINVYNIPLK